MSDKPRGKGRRPAAAGAGDRHPKVSTSKREEAEIKALEARYATELPESGTAEATASEFSELPLSRYTLSGLSRAKFKIMTQVQRIAIPHALAGYVSLPTCPCSCCPKFVVILQRAYPRVQTRYPWSSKDRKWQNTRQVPRSMPRAWCDCSFCSLMRAVQP